MKRKEILETISNIVPKTKSEGDLLKKRTIGDTYHVGGLSGNRLNSGTLRSQFIVCEKESDWTNSDISARRAIHSDQRVFVQKGDDDTWDVYKGALIDSESADPILIYENVKGLEGLLEQERKILLAESTSLRVINNKAAFTGESLQRIYYGCPGSGKSHHVKDITENVDSNFVFRTTFHPDTDYASFVGCYKPTMDGDKGVKQYKKLHELKIEADAINGTSGDKVSQIVAFVTKYAHDLQYIVDTDPNIKSLQNLLNKTLSFANETYLAYVIDYVLKTTEVKITYKFCPQVFTNAYVKAWQNPGEKIYLIIEEINRGNCAQIFGDLFQLLDRKNGVSEYPVKADKDLADYLKSEDVLGANHEGITNGELKLPSNLIIYATMNTSDQSLFPMDSAFKRRWDWEYVPIEYGADKDSYNFTITIGDKVYRWVDFLAVVNDKIYNATNSEDKQMGNFFIKKSIDADTFVNKVMFYLWNEVCKEEYGTNRNFFRREKDGKEVEFKFTDLFGSEKETILNEFMNSLNVPDTNKEAEHKGE